MIIGDDYMAAPILNLGQRERMVYFPGGADWTHHCEYTHSPPHLDPRGAAERSLVIADTSKVYEGGSTEMVPAPLNEFPLFKKTATLAIGN